MTAPVKTSPGRAQDGGDELDMLVRSVRQSAKYARIAEPVVARIGSRELQSRRGLKAAIKATKRKLHQIGGAYFVGDVTYGKWLQEISQLSVRKDPHVLRERCRAIMASHASTRERLPIIDEFFATTLGEIGPIRSILDIACGLTPLAIPWMPLGPQAAYYAYDMYTDLMAFLSDAIAILGMRPVVEATDVTQGVKAPVADVALLLKAIPCLEQIDRSAGEQLLERIPSRRILVSFPLRSLGGRARGMGQNYESRFRYLVKNKGWAVERFVFPTELAFLIQK